MDSLWKASWAHRARRRFPRVWQGLPLTPLPLKARTAVIGRILRTRGDGLVHESIASIGRKAWGRINWRSPRHSRSARSNTMYAPGVRSRSVSLGYQNPPSVSIIAERPSLLCRTFQWASGSIYSTQRLPDPRPNPKRAKLIPAIGHGENRPNATLQCVLKYRSCPSGLTRGSHMAPRRRLVS